VTTWFDSFLAEEGIQQAHQLSALWSDLVDTHNAPLPQSHYVSPLARCLQTSSFVFKPLMASHDAEFSPLVKENLRERWTMHTCDKRRPRSWIEENWADKGYRIEDGFQEDDQLGRSERAETNAEHMQRKQKALEDIFDTDQGQFLSLTIHSIAIRTIFTLCGAPPYRVREGSSVGLLVKGERLRAS
jgi:broad specificity phosphatase PhoE